MTRNPEDNSNQVKFGINPDNDQFTIEPSPNQPVPETSTSILYPGPNDMVDLYPPEGVKSGEVYQQRRPNGKLAKESYCLRMVMLLGSTEPELAGVKVFRPTVRRKRPPPAKSAPPTFIEKSLTDHDRK